MFPLCKAVTVRRAGLEAVPYNGCREAVVLRSAVVYVKQSCYDLAWQNAQAAA